MTSRVVYTALFGAYDHLIDPKHVDPNCDYICFTDQEQLRSNVWVLKIVNSNKPHNITNRLYKTLPHVYLSEYRQSLYIDANIGLKKSPTELFEKYLSHHDIAIPKHPFRFCTYGEIEACRLSNKITSEQEEALREKYQTENFPEAWGLTENNIILRNHNSQNIKNLMDAWYEFIISTCDRDQISLHYLAWKNKIEIQCMNESSKKPNAFFYYRPHITSTNEKMGKKLIKHISLQRADNYFFYLISLVIDKIINLKNNSRKNNNTQKK